MTWIWACSHPARGLGTCCQCIGQAVTPTCLSKQISTALLCLTACLRCAEVVKVLDKTIWKLGNDGQRICKFLLLSSQRHQQRRCPRVRPCIDNAHTRHFCKSLRPAVTRTSLHLHCSCVFAEFIMITTWFRQEYVHLRIGAEYMALSSRSPSK